ncbi:MAG: hypothetical protein AAFO77_15390, partial [Pseudomonadota bacterium]
MATQSLQAKRNEAYGLARRHSTRVLVMRAAMPGAAVLLGVGLTAAIAFVRPGDVVTVAGIELSSISIDGGSLVMANPRLNGVTDADLPYSVRAGRALQAGPTADRIDLEEVTAEFALKDGLQGTMEAAAGVFEREANSLQLTGGSVFR